MEKRCFRQILLILLVFMNLLLMSCASSLINVTDMKAVPKKEAIVIGRVKVISNERPIDWSSFSSAFKSSYFTIYVLPNASSQAISYTLGSDGTFYWHLSPGSYKIAGFDWSEAVGVRRNTTGAITANFNIPEQKRIIYIGTLTLTFGKGFFYYNIGIEDEYEQAINTLKNKFPEVKDEVVKNLMQLERK